MADDLQHAQHPPLTPRAGRDELGTFSLRVVEQPVMVADEDPQWRYPADLAAHRAGGGDLLQGGGFQFRQPASGAHRVFPWSNCSNFARRGSRSSASLPLSAI